MIVGHATLDGREAVIALSLGNPSPDEAGRGRWREVEAVIDTGFTDKLTVPPDVVAALDLPLLGSADVLLADGSMETLPMYRVLLLWHGRERSVRAYATFGSPLVGMSLLRGSRLTIDVVPDGEVSIVGLD